MIAQAPEVSRPTLTVVASCDDQPSEPAPPLSLGRVAGELQLLLAARRHARYAEHAHWYAPSRAR